MTWRIVVSLTYPVLALGSCLVVVGVGCAGDDANPATDAGKDASAGSGGSSGESGVGGDGGQTLRIELSATTVCPGECVEVRAVGMRNGTVQYAWQPALPNSAGPHAFCPSTTTQISVVATVDDPEFSSGPQTASATLVVRDACAIDAALGDAAIDAAESDSAIDAGDAAIEDPPAWFPPSAPTCSVRSSSSGYALPLGIAGQQDHALVVGTFMGTVTIGNQSIAQAPGSPGLNGFVAKLDAQCQPVWMRALTSSNRSIAYAVAENDDGSVLVAGSFDGDVSLGGLPLYAPFHRDLFLLKLSATGDFLWQRQYATTETPGANQVIENITIDGNGGLVMSGVVNAGTDFGNGALDPTQPDQQVRFVVKLDAQGANPTYRRLLPLYNGAAYAQPAGSAVVVGVVFGSWTWSGTTTGADGHSYDVMAGLGPSGLETWSLLTERSSSVVLGGGMQTLAVGADGSSVHAFARALNDEEHALSFLRVGADGALLSHGPELLRFYAPGSVEHYQAQAAVAIDNAGHAWAASLFDGRYLVAGARLDVVGPRDLVALRLDDRGHVTWAGTFGTGSDITEPRITTTSAGSAFVAGTADNELVLVRFAP